MTMTEMKTNDTMQKTTSTMNETNECVPTRTCGSHAPSRMRSHDAKRVASTSRTLPTPRWPQQNKRPPRRHSWRAFAIARATTHVLATLHAACLRAARASAHRCVHVHPCASVRRRAWSGLPPPAILWGSAMTRSSNTSGCVAALAATDGTTAVTDGTTALGALATLATLATAALASAALATTALAALAAIALATRSECACRVQMLCTATKQSFGPIACRVDSSPPGATRFQDHQGRCCVPHGAGAHRRQDRRPSRRAARRRQDRRPSRRRFRRRDARRR